MNLEFDYSKIQKQGWLMDPGLKRVKTNIDTISRVSTNVN
jgi:hypothetical protein